MSEPFKVYEATTYGEVAEHMAVGETEKYFRLTGGRGESNYAKEHRSGVLRRSKTEAIEQAKSMLALQITQYEATIARWRNNIAKLDAQK